MKNLYPIHLLLACTAIAFSSCKKDASTPSCKVIILKTVFSNRSDTSHIYFTYNSDGRLIKNDQGEGSYISFVYSGNTITKTTYVNNRISLINVFTLNSKGYPDMAANKDSDSNIVSNTAFVHDENGYLTSKTTTNKHDNTDILTTTNTYDNKGNMIKSYVEHNIGSAGFSNYSEHDFEYYTDKIVEAGQAPNKIEGRLNTNLVKSEIYSVYGVMSYTYTYSYELNSEGYITKQTMVNGPQIVYTFPEYDCK